MEDWYTITLADITENRGKGVLRYFSSYKDAVMAAFNGMHLVISSQVRISLEVLDV